MEHYLTFLETMNKNEREVFFQTEFTDAEERWFNEMLQSNKQDDELIHHAAERAKGYLKDHELFEFTEFVDKAEKWAALATGLKRNKFSIKEIREQRERVQWEKTKLRKLKPNDEQS